MIENKYITFYTDDYNSIIKVESSDLKELLAIIDSVKLSYSTSNLIYQRSERLQRIITVLDNNTILEKEIAYINTLKGLKLFLNYEGTIEEFLEVSGLSREELIGIIKKEQEVIVDSMNDLNAILSLLVSK